MAHSPMRRNLITLFLACVLVGSALVASIYFIHSSTHTILPTDPNIKYVGRWDTSSSTVAISYWGGAYLKTAFTGTTVKIKLENAVNIFVSIDGKADVLSEAANGTVDLTPQALRAGTHTLRVASRFQSDLIQFQGLILDPEAKTVAPTLSAKLIEFVGDSITAGAKDSKFALSDYAWLVGEQLHTEHTQIAQGGICLIDNIQCYATASHAGMSRQFFKLQTVAFPASPNWNFSRYQASSVVINLGTNDGEKGLSDTTFQVVYRTFIQNIRAKYPHAPIFVLRTFSGYKALPTQAVVRAINAAGEKNVYYINTTGWLVPSDYISDGLHPNDNGQMKIASKLVPILRPYLM
ncbi:MAG: endoglucanase [Ktedonobacteraceae bacterium]|nr:endoglucanase [Ktedonobacteraceae bacterium]